MAPTVLSNVTVTATRGAGSYMGTISVVAFSGADTTIDGAVGGGNAPTGAPTVSLTTTRRVLGVGRRNDWDRPGPGRPARGRRCSTSFSRATGDTYWVQSQTAQGNPANAAVTLSDTAPTADR